MTCDATLSAAGITISRGDNGDNLPATMPVSAALLAIDATFCLLALHNIVFDKSERQTMFYGRIRCRLCGQRKRNVERIISYSRGGLADHNSPIAFTVWSAMLANETQKPKNYLNRPIEIPNSKKFVYTCSSWSTKRGSDSRTLLRAGARKGSDANCINHTFTRLLQQFKRNEIYCFLSLKVCPNLKSSQK
uniref:Uncharacterized protein n=1 Tax=Glossina brevipalpis TaxID=37001 RepID=A0A1A9WUP6_9MUSC